MLLRMITRINSQSLSNRIVYHQFLQLTSLLFMISCEEWEETISIMIVENTGHMVLTTSYQTH